MKKATAVLVLAVLLALICVPAFAVTTYGPGKYVTLGSGTKGNSWTNAAHANVDSISIGGTGNYVSWIRDKKSDKQVTATHYFESTGRKTMLYLKSKKAYVKKDRKYDLRAKSNKDVGKNEQGSIETSNFIP